MSSSMAATSYVVMRGAGRSMLNILGAGLSRTGTTSLHASSEMLGFSSLHFARKRLMWTIRGRSRSFRVFDDVDAVSDLPAALYWRELLDVYPDLRVILTIRQEDAWFESCSRYFASKAAFGSVPNGVRIRNLFNKEERERVAAARARQAIRLVAYGSVQPERDRWINAYRSHNDAVRIGVPKERLLEIDITAGDGWSKLCGFLQVPNPGGSMPHLNSTEPREA